MTTTKKEPWFQTKIRALESELAKYQSSTNGDSSLNIDSYCKGFYDCMSKYSIFAKRLRRRIIKTIKERYKGDGETSYIWRVK